MKTGGIGLLSGLDYEPAEPCSTHPLSTLTAADLLRMTGSQARQDRIIAALEAKFFAHYILYEDLGEITH